MAQQRGEGWIPETRIIEFADLIGKGLAQKLSKIPIGDFREHSGLTTLLCKSIKEGKLPKSLRINDYIRILITIEDSKTLTFGQKRFSSGVHGHNRLRKPLKHQKAVKAKEKPD